MVDPFMPEADKVAAIRDALPSTGAGIYLDTAAYGPIPAESAHAAREADDWELRIGRGGPDREADLAQRLEEARATLAALLGSQTTQIALTSGIGHAIAVAAAMLDWRPGDRLVAATSLDGEALAPLLATRGDPGIELVAADVSAASDDSETVERIAREVDSRTRLIVVPHVAGTTGASSPVDELAGVASAHGAWLVVDAGHSAGAVPVDPAAMAADVVALAGHRWLLGPEATGALWVGARALAEGRAMMPGLRAFETLTGPGVARTWPDARRFEADVPGRTAALQLARGVGWLEMYVGLEWAYERTARLGRALRDGLSAIESVQLLTPPGAPLTIVTFRIAGWTADEIAEALSRRVFAIVGRLPAVDAVRMSVAFFNTEDELGRVVEAVAELARHSPSTLPQRPGLVVLPSPPAPPGSR